MNAGIRRGAGEEHMGTVTGPGRIEVSVSTGDECGGEPGGSLGGQQTWGNAE